uniref:B30.2/SPRY domain-containing protein n=1 Tax=Stegastes partitus TaxID=144197 RepID=A0A3B5BEY5_9TELE
QGSRQSRSLQTSLPLATLSSSSWGIRGIPKPVERYNPSSWLSRIRVTQACCHDISKVLSSQSCSLKDLDLSNNDLQDSGVKLLSDGLKNPHCALEALRLLGCLVTVEGCISLVSALRSNPSHLKELDLSYNHPGDSGVTLLLAAVKEPHNRLDTLRYGQTARANTGFLYACELTLDTNTANRKLRLSDNSRTVTSVKKQQPYPDHPERFEFWPQLLCRDALTGRCYWEMTWGGRVSISVTYRGISRRRDNDESWLGRNKQSWSLICSDVDGYSVWHNKRRTVLPPASISHRVAVYVDCPAGVLSFYSVSSDTLTHLHTFHTTFTEPLYPGFGFAFGWPGSSVSLCAAV